MIVAIDAQLFTNRNCPLSVLREMDADLRKWLQSWGRPYAVVATKVDKLKTQKERHSLTKLMADDGAPFIPFSAITGQGVREIWQTISKTNHQT